MARGYIYKERMGRKLKMLTMKRRPPEERNKDL
jgi:hypothetical protein